MITGAHSIIYSKDAEADRVFLRDVLKLTNVDVGCGWLIFGSPPPAVAELFLVRRLYLCAKSIQQRWQSSHGLHRKESSSVRAKRFQKRWDASPSPPTSTSGIPLMSRFCVFRRGRLPIRIIRTAHSGSSIM